MDNLNSSIKQALPYEKEHSGAIFKVVSMTQKGCPLGYAPFHGACPLPVQG